MIASPPSVTLSPCPPFDAGPSDCHLGLDGSGGAVGDDLKRLGEGLGGGQRQPRRSEGVQLARAR